MTIVLSENLITIYEQFKSTFQSIVNTSLSQVPTLYGFAHVQICNKVYPIFYKSINSKVKAFTERVQNHKLLRCMASKKIGCTTIYKFLWFYNH